ncbi:hypothetical protein PsorP6_010707 [Peronosclerospora sorghi]|uniref:Uncharacterized protein n=1 Tax=Peronosclerospora sorghi TaxID=230839 RepID=A0ACC0VXK2_9STRA|nr:hypothetical protein PsorP6_010707 [Peronosclerospora sorghi]
MFSNAWVQIPQLTRDHYTSVTYSLLLWVSSWLVCGLLDVTLKRNSVAGRKCSVLARQNIGADGCVDAHVHTVSEQPVAQSNMCFHEQAHLCIGSLLLFSIAPQSIGPSLCPSGVKGYVQVVMFSNAWVQIPQLTTNHFYGLLDVALKRNSVAGRECCVLARQNIGADGCVDAHVHTVSEQPVAQSNMCFHEQAHLCIGSLLLFSIAPQGFEQDILTKRSARQFARV